MKERISCFDIDGTLSRGMLFVPLVKSEYESGYLNASSFAKIRELLADYTSGKLEYEDAVEKLLQAHAEGLEGKNHEALKTHTEDFLASHEGELFHKFGRKVIRLLKTKQKIFVVTAEPQYLAEAVVDMYDMNGYISSVYDEESGVLTGKVGKSLAHRSAKSLALRHYDIEHAFGDSEGDINMLSDAKYRYCISPTDGLTAVARERNWKIYNGDDNDLIVKDVKAILG